MPHCSGHSLTERGFYRARRWLAKGKTEGLSILPVNLLGSSRGGAVERSETKGVIPNQIKHSMTNQAITFIPYHDAPNKGAIRKLYRTAFPKAERAPFLLLRRLAKKGECAFSGCYQEGKFVGLTVAVEQTDFTYLFFLAVEEGARSHGFGGRILEAVKEHYAGKPVVLDMEERNASASNREQRERRYRFYEKHGFAPAGYTYTFKGVTYEVLSFGGEVTKERYYAFLKERIPRFHN